jgi:cell division protein FtsN
MHTNAKTRQTGKGVTSFIVGLLIATIIIAGILYFLSNSKSDFKNPAVNNNMPTAPEILTPHSSSLPDLPSPAIPPRQSGSEPVIAASHPVSSEIQNIEDHNPDLNNPDIQKPAQQPNPVKPNNPPLTPEQILNSGSIEKAQHEVKKKKKQSGTNKVYLQIGSFNNRTDADAQRAKLIMLGINSNISNVEIQGNTRYRVITKTMNQNEANQIQEILKQNNLDSLAKSAP